MKAKLIKVENTFYLKQGETILATSSIPNLSASIRYSLSKQNCDEIFGVVDVEKLAEARYPNEVGYAVSDSNFRIGELQDAYQEGFNKAMELNKDKVFTEEDMRKAYFDGYNDKEENKFFNPSKSIQQPTEIEVTFNPEERDSEGCLILKKI